MINVNPQIQRMQSALASYLKKQQKQDADSHYAMQGIYQGDKVQVNGVQYPADLAVDLQLYNGAYVYCVWTSDKKGVVIVGG